MGVSKMQLPAKKANVPPGALRTQSSLLALMTRFLISGVPQ